MKSLDNKEVSIGTNVWVAGFQGSDKFWKPIPKKLEPTFRAFYADFQNCVEWCKIKNGTSSDKQNYLNNTSV